MNLPGLYDLLALGLPEAAVVAWLSGQESALPKLSTAERRMLADAWWFNARPGQFWTPGPEFITDDEAGRGWGKNFAAAETLCEQARDPERWGGYAIIVGPEPTQVKRDCLFGPSGVFAAAKRRARSGNGPGIADRNLVDRWLRFEAPRGGGDGGLTVYWAASSDPKSVHGANVGLVWWDEYGVSYHRKYDEQGNNAWQALMPAVRAGPDPKIIITQTPSRAPEVRALQADAERPECPACRRRALAAAPYSGEVLKEPWRLPRSEQRRLHPLLNTRTTVPVRQCPACGGQVTARVRAVYGDTRDNPAIALRAREDADRALSTGQTWAYLRFAPRGEVDAGGAASPVKDEHVARVVVPDPAAARGGAGPVPDRWRLALAALGADEVVVQVDPAVTANEGSDESGLVVAARCPRIPGWREDLPPPAGPCAVGLEDLTVRPDEVEGGAPSAVWGPRAYRAACLWGASRIVVEVNQGGEEVVSVVRDLVRSPPTEAQVMAWLRELNPDVVDARLGGLARRIAASARGIRVETVTRQADKRPRMEWYGGRASEGRMGVLCAEWLGGAVAWATCLAQVTGYEPPSPTAPAARKAHHKDRGDALVASAQVLLGVRETRGGVDDRRAEPVSSWMGKVGGAFPRG